MKVINIITEQSWSFSHHTVCNVVCITVTGIYSLVTKHNVIQKHSFSPRNDISYDDNFLFYGIPFCDSGIQLGMCTPQSHMTKGDIIKCNSINST